jgi:hypothetical protein
MKEQYMGAPPANLFAIIGSMEFAHTVALGLAEAAIA